MLATAARWTMGPDKAMVWVPWQLAFVPSGEQENLKNIAAAKGPFA
jgi:hypothetical protein